MISFDRDELDFQLYDFIGLDDLGQGPFEDYSREASMSILDTAQSIARDKFLPHADKSDQCEPVFEDGRAILIPEIAEALNAFRDAGFFGASFSHEDGGLQMPETLRSAVSYLFFTANIGTSGYILLTNGAANVLAAFADEKQKADFLHPLIEGRYFGTMCLSEPHAGSSLADITTTAAPLDDGSFHLRGRKMWISGGEQEISENIVHLVLAKEPGVGEGVRGISMFIAPKFLLDDEGRPGPRNGITLAGLNHKMGYRGTTNTALNFGDDKPCVAYRVGNAGMGLKYMFQMMNEARIAVGLGATAIAAAGYGVALEYAKERVQGRSPDAKDPSLPPVPIIGHADVRRLLLEQKVAVEGSLSLLLFTASLIDRARLSIDEAEKHRLQKLTDFLTPIAKSWPSEFCLEANKHAIQVLGGSGYTRDYPLERLYRDNRLNPIHEGTHGIHGIDLLGRKTLDDQADGLNLLHAEIDLDLVRGDQSEKLREFSEALRRELNETVEVTQQLLAQKNAYERSVLLANATLYLDMLGHLIIGWMWLRQAIVAEEKQGRQDHDQDLLEGKYWACRYFFRYVLPRCAWMRQSVASLDDTSLRMPVSGF